MLANQPSALLAVRNHAQPKRRSPKLLTLLLAAASAVFGYTGVATAEPANFSQAKRLLKEHVYHDQNARSGGSFYCGCDWVWNGKSGGKMELSSCGFQTWTHRDRATRLEWEHVLPAHSAAQHRQCWREGGRANCQKTDPVFNRIEADMHNVVPSVGAANAIRSHFPLGMVAGTPSQLGQCTSKFDMSGRVVEPRDESKGMAARITFYMADRYKIRLSSAQQRVLMAWDRAYPVSAFELERDRRIAYSMGHHNDFVTGAAKWTEGYKPRGLGLVNDTQRQQAPTKQASNQARPAQMQTAAASSNPIIGNRNSKVYHLPSGCPSYTAVGERNRVMFSNETEAQAAGFRKAGNCS